MSSEGDLIDRQWEPGTWAGLQMLTCIICRWDTLRGLAAAREHASACRRCHPPETEPPTTHVLVADRSGREVSKGEELP